MDVLGRLMCENGTCVYWYGTRLKTAEGWCIGSGVLVDAQGCICAYVGAFVRIGSRRRRAGVYSCYMNRAEGHVVVKSNQQCLGRQCSRLAALSILFAGLLVLSKDPILTNTIKRNI